MSPKPRASLRRRRVVSEEDAQRLEKALEAEENSLSVAEPAPPQNKPTPAPPPKRKKKAASPKPTASNLRREQQGRRLVIYLPPELEEEFRVACARQRRSLSNGVEIAVRDWLGMKS